MEQNFISCDWGTTNLRVRLVEAAGGKVLAHITNDQGISKTYDHWHQNQDQDRVEFYLAQLESAIQDLDQNRGLTDETPVIISGMASSTIGMIDLPYSPTPFELDGRKIEVKPIKNQSTSRPVWLVSGIRHKDDVIRGEETQVLGLTRLGEYDLTTNVTVVIPGTHSKHVSVIDHWIDGFKTFMTGELFGLLLKHSVLADSVQQPHGNISEDQQMAFADGVNQSQIAGISRSLFKVRTNQLSEKFTAVQNYYYMSGLLLGAELEGLPSAGEILFCGGARMNQLYELGVNVLGVQNRSHFLSDDEVQGLAVLGHQAIYEQLNF